MEFDALFHNGVIATGDPAHPAATRLAVHGGRIIALDDEIVGRPRQSIDLHGARVLPGFHDAHYHLSLTGARLAALDLRPSAVTTLDELYRALGEYASGLAPDAWVKASGYDQNVLGAHPTAEGIDAVVGGRPASVEHVSGHMLVANTAAFARAGFADRIGVPEVAGGHVERDASGRASGLLQERAQEIINAVTRPLALEEVQRNLQLASDQAVAYGLTSLTEPGIGAPEMIGNTQVDLHSYQVAVEAGVIRPRMTVMPYISTLHDITGTREPDWFGIDLGIRTGFGDDRLSIGPVKIVSDGSLIGKSAAMHHCYHGEPENAGFMLVGPEQLRQQIIGAHAAGWTVATHAIGDSAVDHVLDAVAEAQQRYPRPGVRHRIEHFAVASDAQVARAAELGVIPVPQGTFISDFGDGMSAALGEERTATCYRVASLLAAGIVVPGSTDSPVSDGNPLRSIHDMVNRLTASGRPFAPEERVSIEDAVRAYTYGSAYAVGKEDRVGTLAAGMLADFVVLSDDIFAVDSAAIKDITVTGTVIGGEVVYDAGAFGKEAAQ
ncbi:amidohydrolase [Microterricola viridarii]|uniref:Amidohydrolase 3 domain-containing protein n=1 Tax=Microterricola viridarii TaxID=412690 RepID=A0A1H1QPV6_9MICO|nr:amidohydrolase [Microterricola viridarii]SDS25510.1 hypothetical protein SAMN04489834_1145 [Microterricola viridarii]